MEMQKKAVMRETQGPFLCVRVDLFVTCKLKDALFDLHA